jgi:hypothetical protein
VVWPGFRTAVDRRIGSKVLLHGTPAAVLDRGASLDDAGDRGGPTLGRLPEGVSHERARCLSGVSVVGVTPDSWICLPIGFEAVACRLSGDRRTREGRGRVAVSALGFGRSDEAAHDWMPVKVTQTGNGAPSRIIDMLQDLIGWYLDALALGLDPVATGSIHLVIGGLTISLRRATGGIGGIQWSFDPRYLKALEPIGKLVPWLMSRRARRQQKYYASQGGTHDPTRAKRAAPANSGHGVQVIERR